MGIRGKWERDGMKLKILFFVISLASSFWITYSLYDIAVSSIISLVIAFTTVALIFAVERHLNEVSRNSIIGLSVGIVAATLALIAIKETIESLNLPPVISAASYIIAFTLLYYVGISEGMKRGGETDHGGRRFPPKGGLSSTKILDTSVIIDGRIADVAEAGFIDGVMLVPKFIIKELQYIADSNDPIKRVRGRRGLDVLRRMQQEIPNVVIKITSHDFPRINETDLKLVELAKRLKGIVITNDFNLNKIAGLQGVKVLNLNQLSSALKPVVLPGESLNINVVKEGKEENQGVGYLEDGTMVVVDDGKKYLGRDIEVLVTSVLQTPTGRMIFSKAVLEEIVSKIKVS